MSDTASEKNINFQGRIKAVQWNNIIKTNIMMVSFLLVIFIFVTLLMALVVGAIAVFDGKEALDIIQDETFQFRYARIYLKILVFSIAGAFYFIYRDFQHSDEMFGARPLSLAHDDEFYRVLENACISRGVTVPELSVIEDEEAIDTRYVTAVVLQGPQKQAKLIITPATYHLPLPQLEAIIAQAVHRIHTRNTLFFTVFSFLAYFPFHMKRNNPIARYVLGPLLWVIDMILKPLRKSILNMRFTKVDVGAIEITKDKAAMHDLINNLATLEQIKVYYHDAFLPLFITGSDSVYRKEQFKKA